MRSVALLLAVLASGCAASLREHTTPFPTGTPQVEPWQLNRELLQPVNRRILVTVENLEQKGPDPRALDELTALASRYGERLASWVWLGGTGAPKVRWRSTTLEADAPLDADTSYVFVRFVGKELPNNFGWSFTQQVRGHLVYCILVNLSRHRRFASAVLPERRLEEQTLVHEYGHMLGLPTPDHGYYALYPSWYGGAHCVNPDCALSKPRARAVFYGIFHTGFGRHFLEDYCAQCRKMIEEAKAFWRKHVA